MRSWHSALLIAALGAVCSCSPTGGEYEGRDTSDAETSDVARTDSDIADASVDGDTRPQCEYQSDCPDGSVCVQGSCRSAPACNRPSSWQDCVEHYREIDPDVARRSYCDGSHCAIACLFDAHCPSGQICTDNGDCREFAGELTGEDPGGAQRKPLRAGVGRKLLDVPIGLSLGGYGSRMANDDGRYVEELRATHGQMHGLYARAFVLDNGRRKLMFVRLPIIFSTAALHEAVARRLQEATGRDWRDSLLISATHTHSGPARFYHLPRETLLPLGRLGTDTFHHQAFQWLADSAAGAARSALDDLSGAAFGAEVVESFDTDDAISSDRWGETPPFDSNRLLLMRIDDTSGVPRAVGVSFGTHGTIHSGDYYTGDALSGIERGLETALAREYDRYVPVLFFNQNGGTMSPRGDGRGHDGPQRFERLGDLFAQRIIDDVRQMQTDRSLQLDGVTYRFPITYDLVGYDGSEFGGSGLATVDENYLYGGLGCPAGNADSDPSTHTKPEDLNCLGIHRLLFHRPPTLFVRSQMSAFELGNHTLVTAPGELSMELSWQIVRRLKRDHGLDPARTWTLGYAQDHQFYLLPNDLRGNSPPFSGYRGPDSPGSYPERAFSYLQGGYEARMSFWGWKFGDYLVERASDTVARIEAEDVERELPAVLPTQFSTYGKEPFPVEQSDPDRVGTVVDQPPEQVERFQTIEFAWIGGDPGAERPQSPRVALQRKQQGTFRTVKTERLRPYTNREPVMLTRLRRRDGHWEWVVRWEELRDFEVGTYRFRVEGSFRASSGNETYTTESRPFEVKPTDEMVVDAQFQNETISGTIGYPAGSPFEYAARPEDPGAVEGRFRLPDPDVPTGTPAPPEVGHDLDATDVRIVFRQGGSAQETLTGTDLQLQTVEADRGGTQGVPTTRYSASTSNLPSGSYQVTVRVEDTYDNTGRTQTQHSISN